MYIHKILSVLIINLIVMSAHAEQETVIDDSIPWKVEKVAKDIGDVATWRRPVPGADIKQFRGEVILNHPASHILFTIDTAEDLQKWVFFCRDSDRVEPDYSYMEYKGIWPVAPRYVTVASTSWIENGVIYIESKNIDSAGPVHEDMVKITEFNNLFEITPISAQQTKVRFTTFVDLSGKLPAWLANQVSSRAPLVTLSNMRDLLDDGEWNYSQKTVDELSGIAHHHMDELKYLLAGLE